MRRKRSHALDTLRGALRRSRSLLHIERSRHFDPPKPRQKTASEALRGASIVLLTASFEEFLKDLFRELTDELEKKRRRGSAANFSDGFLVENFLGSVEALIKETRLERGERNLELRRLASLISDGAILAEGFTRTNANPGPRVVTEMLKRWGVSNPLEAVSSDMATRSGYPWTKSLVDGKIAEIISRRNEVAHQGFVQNVSLVDISGYIDFIEETSRSIDKVCIDEFKIKCR